MAERPIVEFERLTYSYPAEQGSGLAAPVLDNLSLSIAEGDFVLVVGRSGAGKSTLLRCFNGLVPHFYGGAIGGRIRVDGQDPVAMGPRGMSTTVGFVFQDPEAQAVVDEVEDELAFALENCGLPPATMRGRVEQVLDQLDIVPLRRRLLSTLSGGERQRVAIAAVLTLQPKVLVLDEPTSQLDPQSAEEVLHALVRLNHTLGLTVILSEHRLERIVAYTNRVLYLPGCGESPIWGRPAEVLAQTPLAPPLIDLGKRLGWSPLPLTVEEARKQLQVAGLKLKAQGDLKQVGNGDKTGELVLEICDLGFAYNGAPILQGINLQVRQGEFVAVMGRNGAGKTTLLKQCIGLLKPRTGRIKVLGLDTQKTPVEELARHVGYVPQNPNALLFADSIAAELAFTRRAQNLPLVADEPLLHMLGLAGMADRYPRDLSVGERQRVALAAVLVSDPDLILLDEPTRGLDYEQKAVLIAFLRAQKERGKTVIVVTHDVELVAQCAERVVLMGDGAIVADGPVRQVMSHAQAFASQINRLFQSSQFLTVQDVLTALEP